MAGSVNKVILIGNLGKTPEIRSMQNGDRVATLSLATSESWKDKTTGERKERTQWHMVVIFNQSIVDVAAKYLHKGSKVYVEGQLETRKWQDKDGHDRYTTEVVIKPYKGTLNMLGGAKTGGTMIDDDDREMDPETVGEYESKLAEERATQPALRRGVSSASIPDDLNDDIPF